MSESAQKDDVSLFTEELARKLPIFFESTHSSYQRKGGDYENLEQQEDVIEIVKNSEVADGYLLSIYGKNSGIYRVQNVPVRIDSVSHCDISFRGYIYEEKSFFGSRTVDGSIYGIDVFYNDDTPAKAVFHRFDLCSNFLFVNQDIEQVNDSEDNLDSFLESFETVIGETETDHSSKLHILEERLSVENVMSVVDSSLHNDIIAEGLILGLMENQIKDRERAAEISLYSLTSAFIEEERLEDDNRIAVYLDLFHLLHYGHKELIPLIRALIHKADDNDAAISDEAAEQITSTILDQLSYLAEKVIAMPLGKDKDQYLKIEEKAFMERIQFIGMNKNWFRLGEDTSLFLLLRNELKLKYSTDN